MQILNNHKEPRDQWPEPVNLVNRPESGIRNNLVTLPFAAIQTMHTWHDQIAPSRIALQIDGKTDLSALAQNYNGVDVVRIRFDRFDNGIGFSVAQIIRQYFSGEIWGLNVISENAWLHAQAGFDCIVLSDNENYQQALTNIHQPSVTPDYYRSAIAKASEKF